MLSCPAFTVSSSALLPNLSCWFSAAPTLSRNIRPPIVLVPANLLALGSDSVPPPPCPHALFAATGQLPPPPAPCLRAPHTHSIMLSCPALTASSRALLPNLSCWLTAAPALSKNTGPPIVLVPANIRFLGSDSVLPHPPLPPYSLCRHWLVHPPPPGAPASPTPTLTLSCCHVLL